MYFFRLWPETMKIYRINTILLHTWYHFLHSMETWVDLFWNSTLQILVYVFLARVFSHSSTIEFTRYLIVGAILWNAIWVAQYGICLGALWEIWAKSFSTMFISPLTLNEFLVGQMISGAIKSVLAVAMSAIIAYYLYGFSIFSLGWILIPAYLLLLIFGWGLGMLVLSLIFRFGTQVQSLSWSVVFLVQPLGGVFYPLSVLPEAMRWVGEIMPSSYIFISIREYLKDGRIAWTELGIGLVLSIAYFLIGYLVLTHSFRQAKITGAFARMEG
ncbi:MAG: ABC2 transporter [Candidatus Nomurabacteria bacterium GW2011_GWB1_37_5]|uniref:Transport permease protein n=1 Tax=Candidatus Nomurabacteria bacterium GW2011_GWB1_37_5 TaxID=1618742 RepID=A0A0G0H5V0_9BACT|nr:MAG: ABC2 transporter [Candidatus Nomurabacteria bacterium GW2011_GWB1_37_5]